MVGITVVVFPKNVVLWLVDYDTLGCLDQDELEVWRWLNVHHVAVNLDVLNHLVISKIPYHHMHREVAAESDNTIISYSADIDEIIVAFDISLSTMDRR